MIANILFPVDFSESCLGMAAYVKRVAAMFHARVTMLHVCDLNSHNGFELYVRTLQEIADEHWMIARERLHSFLPCEFPSPTCARLLRSGDPAEEIVELAHSSGFDLIVMPTHAGRFRQMLLGSTTAKVLDEADCPVLTMEHAETSVPNDLGHRHWLCGIGHGREAEQVFRIATLFAERAHAQLSFVHVIDDVSDGDIPRSLAGENINVVKGRVKDALLEAAQRPLADALIVGRAPKHGLIGRMRDFTYGLIRDSPVPVLSV